MLLSIPRGVVNTASFRSELLLGEADTSITASVRANCSLTSNTFVVREALAFTSLAVAKTLVGAFNDWMGIVGVLHVTDPSRIPVVVDEKKIPKSQK